MNALAVVGSVFVLLAAVIHVIIFVMESVLWSRPATWRRFGLRSQDDADTTKSMAFNQGFYNLFLAIGAALGIVLLGSPDWAQAGARHLRLREHAAGRRRAGQFVTEAAAGGPHPGTGPAAGNRVPPRRLGLSFD